MPSDETRIMRSQEDMGEAKVKQSKKIIDKVLSYIVTINDLSDITLSEILEKSGFAEEQYNNVLLKSNMNMQFVAGVHVVLTYVTYFCKPEVTMSKIMKKALKEVYGKDMTGKMHSVGNVFSTNREVSLPMRLSNTKKNRTRMFKPLSILNVFASNIIGKYENQPDDLHSLCLADFASRYISKKAVEVPIEPDEIKSYSAPVVNIDDVKPNLHIIILKN